MKPAPAGRLRRAYLHHGYSIETFPFRSWHTWEGRFKSQALLDEKALAARMAYVDLNPIRGRMANTPAQSEHTSIKRRIKQAHKSRQPCLPEQQSKGLLAFASNPREDMPDGIPFVLSEYLALVDWSGRIIREDNKSHIQAHLPDMLQRLDINPRNWMYLTKNFEQPFKNQVGTAHNVHQACEDIGKNWVHGINHCEILFSSA
ncbi:MAG: hypothetical protein KJO91_06195 [Gammaproteobacteria bacterium]|nr:hypothetical protein [Gammaproteobacteria bacterium]